MLVELLLGKFGHLPAFGDLPVDPGGDATLRTTPNSFLNAELPPDQIPPAYRDLMGRSAVQRALDKLARLSQEEHIPVLVVGGLTTAPSEPFEDGLKARGFHTLNIQSPREWWVSDTDGHLNPKGHAAFAEAIERAIEAERLLPP
jgi:hypothetical protein